MTKGPTKADLEKRVAELEGQLGAEKLNGEAITECRSMLAEIGHSGIYFDDCVAAAIREIKALRYDVDKYRRMYSGMWKYDQHPEQAKRLKPKRDGSEPQAWVATVALAS